MKQKKITFKTTKPTGRFRAFESSYHEIKVGKTTVGNISDTEPHKVRLMAVKDNIHASKNPCPWEWRILKQEFSSIQGAQKYLTENSERIFKSVNLYIEPTN